MTRGSTPPPSIVPLATSVADFINSWGEPPEAAASVVGAQMAGPSYPTLADLDDVAVVTLRPLLEATALTINVVPEVGLEPPPKRETPKPTAAAKTVAPTRKSRRPRISSERRGA